MFLVQSLVLAKYAVLLRLGRTNNNHGITAQFKTKRTQDVIGVTFICPFPEDNLAMFGMKGNTKTLTIEHLAISAKRSNNVGLKRTLPMFEGSRFWEDLRFVYLAATAIKHPTNSTEHIAPSPVELTRNRSTFDPNRRIYIFSATFTLVKGKDARWYQTLTQLGGGVKVFKVSNPKGSL